MAKHPDMVFTDPPYNVDYGASKNPQGWTKERRVILNDKLSQNDWVEFNKKIIEHLRHAKEISISGEQVVLMECFKD